MDGKRLIANGKSLVAALCILKKELKGMTDEPEWLNPKLKADLESVLANQWQGF